MRILIVDDDRKLAHQLKTGMEEQGHAVAAVADVMEEGLEAARRGGFDVPVLGSMLLGMDGFSIVRRLRAVKSAAPIAEVARGTWRPAIRGAGSQGSGESGARGN